MKNWRGTGKTVEGTCPASIEVLEGRKGNHENSQ
jgi:hypothetical protein